LVLTASSSQRAAPLKMPPPKSSVTMNEPLETTTALFVSESLNGRPPLS
jgi:hypothetical protein